MKLKYLSPLVLALTASVAQVPKAQAKPNYGMAGCGLGSIITQPHGNQVSAATTNGTFGNQIFGIVSGTSNCKTSSEVAVLLKQSEFLSANLSTLQKEMAQGNGSTISAFVEVLGCSNDVQDQASQILVKNFSKIFDKPGIQEILDSTKESFLNDQQLARSCQDLG